MKKDKIQFVLENIEEHIEADSNLEQQLLQSQHDLKVAREALEKAEKMFKEEGHCPWFNINEVFECENCNDNCMLPTIQQALSELKKEVK